MGKLSMVMPCYNKAEYIGEMFDSIIAQKWDNIELIMVNDGSTDGTREIIAEYEPRFRRRGYEAVIVDQENQGVCAAARAGLERVTGDYICMIDADDELDPEYASTMAGWLQDHPECDYVLCSAVSYTGTGSNKLFEEIPVEESPQGDICQTEMYLTERTIMTAWRYMARKEYLERCGIADVYSTDTHGSHEPEYIIPLTACGGRARSFTAPLYRLSLNGEGHSRFARFEQAEHFYNEYCALSKNAIMRLPDSVDGPTKEKWIMLAEIMRLRNLLMYSGRFMPDDAEMRNGLVEELIAFAHGHRLIPEGVCTDAHADKWRFMIIYLRSILLGERPPGLEGARRVIAYGALGKIAARYLPLLEGSRFCPDVLWDKAGDGIVAERPDFGSLTPQDALIVFPRAKAVVEEVQRMSEGSNAKVISGVGEVDRLAAFSLYANNGVHVPRAQMTPMIMGQ